MNLQSNNSIHTQYDHGHENSCDEEFDGEQIRWCLNRQKLKFIKKAKTVDEALLMSSGLLNIMPDETNSQA